MAKLLLFTICACLSLISTLRLRASYIRRTDPNFGLSSPQPLQVRRLTSYGKQGWKFFKLADDDPRSVESKSDYYVTSINSVDSRPVDVKVDYETYLTQEIDGAPKHDLEPLHVCERKAPISHHIDMQIFRKYERCTILNSPPEETTILLLSGVETFGRTGNNLIEFLHALQYGKDRGVLVAIMWGSWPLQLITKMWMAIPGDSDVYRQEWRHFLEQAFCVKIFDHVNELEQYEKVIHRETRDLFMYKSLETWGGPLNQYIEFQCNIVRTLFRFYNDGTGINLRRKPVADMCSVLDAMFGDGKQSARYSVIHSRYLEGELGLRLLERIARNVGCDPVAALHMEPEYVKAILKPLEMLDDPIIFITDHQKPEILENLLADQEIGPNIYLVPDEASWIGGDLAVATMADVFIGNPASTFSGFIAKSRVALGYTTTYLFRKKNRDGEWVDVCDERAIFDEKVMNAMA